jgi:hypothetical protein
MREEERVAANVESSVPDVYNRRRKSYPPMGC